MTGNRRFDRRRFVRSTALGGCAWLMPRVSDAAPGQSAPRVSRADFDWRFQPGDVEGAREPGFDDSRWRTLDLPHDWGVEGEYSPDAGDWQSGYLPAGIGWYRKRMQWQPGWAGKRVKILFDGIYCNSDVWINGHHLGAHPNGYIGFEFDLTDHLEKGMNVVAVRVDHSKPLSGRWYTGSGIYRHVWLIVTDPVHIETWGTFFTTPEVGQEQARFRVVTDLSNKAADNRGVTLSTVLLDREGRTVAKQSTPVELRPGAMQSVTQNGTIAKPVLWSPGNPYLYTLRTTVESEGRPIDVSDTRVGIRKLEFSGSFGFKLNGKVMKLKGVCEHHTAGAVGSAVPDSLLRWRLELLKAMGCNAIRTSHNPVAPVFYDLCDELGLMVLSEALDGWDKPKARDDYGNYFKDWWKEDLTRFIRRDRNHPSVIMWSIGNEVAGADRNTQKQLVDLFHSLDPTRPVTQGGKDPTRGMKGDTYASQLDIHGFNGDGEEQGVLEKFHAAHPEMPVVCTEVPHTYQTRGVYRTQTQWRVRDFPAPWEIRSGKAGKLGNLAEAAFPIPDLTPTEVFPEAVARTFFYKGREVPLEMKQPWQPTLYYQSSYDNATVRISARKAWQRTRDFEFVIGHFRWSGFDYLGETNQWPSRCANFGIIDLCGFPKDQYHLYRSMWTDAPMVHILPHWTHPGKEAVSIPVVVYTNCDSVELFLNGKSLGEKPYKDEQLVWMVPYQPGTLRAIARRNGKQAAEAVQVTAHDPARLRIRASNLKPAADRTGVVRMEIDVVDSRNVLVPAANHMIEFAVTGPARLIGVDNGDPLDLSPYRTNRRRAFHGKCLALVQVSDRPGEISFAAASAGLRSATVRLRSAAVA